MLFSVFISVFLYILFCYFALFNFQVRHKWREQKFYLLTVSNVRMKILWFEWLIISLFKLLNRN
jgi:hypothetical protein